MGCPGHELNLEGKISRCSAATNSSAGGHHQRKAARSSRSAARITAHVAPNVGATRDLSSDHHCATSARSGAHQPATSSVTICAGQGQRSADWWELEPVVALVVVVAGSRRAIARINEEMTRGGYCCACGIQSRRVVQ
ncbi:hypothetical protein F511_21152 [Dorcoceras hygrometricum]|uniref:Uncharacterized protein n=1 Tax=Dorcoceras hygrometricum TaxID=472368 RepID=A0A2Z7AG01_9LAMI|nr:hypothetical protein F511_21152 [Dorcoceras hygrometricum]